jgi:hypothetical protein
MNTNGNVVDVTGTIHFKQTFFHRIIEDAEYSYPTGKDGKSISKIETPCMKIVDITPMLDRSAWFKDIGKEMERFLLTLKETKGARDKKSKLQNEYANQKIEKLAHLLTNGKSVYLAYFRVDYDSEYRYGKPKRKLQYHDFFVSVYIDNHPTVGNLCGYQYFLKSIRSDVEQYRDYIKRQLENAYELRNLGVDDLDVLIQMMLKYAPKKPV